MDSVRSSRKTLIVLSNSYVSSDWTKMEFRTAHSLAKRDNCQRVVMVIMEKLENTYHLDKDFKQFLQLNKGIYATDKKFWVKLR